MNKKIQIKIIDYVSEIKGCKILESTKGQVNITPWGINAIIGTETYWIPWNSIIYVKELTS